MTLSNPMPVAYLEKLNSEQRRAVEHGVGENACAPTGPLLVIAGAGSGKTNTLAHRVAHFIVNGADPRRILLGAAIHSRAELQASEPQLSSSRCWAILTSPPPINGTRRPPRRERGGDMGIPIEEEPATWRVSGGFGFADCCHGAAINRSTSETAHCIEVVRNSATIRTALRTIHARDGCF
jgi:hypothetical protein